MGIIINDTIILRNGLELANLYASLSSNEIRLRKQTPLYAEPSANTIQWCATTEYSVWANSGVAGKSSPLQIDSINATLTDGQSVFEALYTAMKAKYTSTSDA